MIALLAVLIIGIFGYELWNNAQINQTDDATSLKNYNLSNEAARNGDASYCGQITGSIHPVIITEHNPPKGFADGVSARIPSMNEADAKKDCRKRAQYTIDQRNYQKQVCADQSIKEYYFGTGTHSCP